MAKTTPDPVANFAILTKYLAEIAVRTANQSAEVLTAAATKLDNGKYTVDDSYQTATALAGISLLGWTEATTSIVAGLGFAVLDSAAHSEWYAVPGKTTQPHHVKVPGGLSRSVSNDVIHQSAIGYEGRMADDTKQICLGGNLPAGTAYFRLLVNRTGKHSGCYVGKASVTQLPDANGAGGAPAVQMDVEIEL